MHSISRGIALTALLALAMPVAQAAPVPETLAPALTRHLGVAPDSVSPAPIEGLYEAVFGARVIYVDAEGRHVIQGDVIDLDKRENLTEPRRNGIRRQAISRFGDEDSIVYAPEAGKLKYTVVAFTDPDCGYCRKLHSQMAEYNKAGIAIRYLFFPRTGPGSPSFRKAVSAWCAPDRNKALTQAKAGTEIEKRECKNPVMDHYELAEELNLSGTPALILPDGRLLPGYVPPAELVRILEGKPTRTVPGKS